MKYNIHIKQDTNGEYLITFPEVPEAATTVECLDQINQNAIEALVSAFDWYVETKRPIPMPKKRAGKNYVILPASLTAKMHLYNEWLASKTKKSDLAARPGVAQSNLERLFNLHYRSKIESIEKALGALGKTLEIKIA